MAIELVPRPCDCGAADVGSADHWPDCTLGLDAVVDAATDAVLDACGIAAYLMAGRIGHPGH